MNAKLKNKIYMMIISLGLMFISPAVLAVPAYEAEQELKQPTGEKFKASLHGDEWFNWVEAETGEVIVQDTDKFWKFGEVVSGEIKAGVAKYKVNKKPKGALEHKDVIKIKEQKKLKDNKDTDVKASFSSENTQIQAISDTTQKVLVLLIQFSDTSIKNSDSTWSNQFFGTSGSTVNKYFKEVSNGKFYFTPAEESSGTANDGVIKVTLGYPHPNTGRNIGYANQKMVSDALAAADSYINYASYDTDGNGSISTKELHIVTTVAGYESAYGGGLTPGIWAHRWSTSANLDGKYLSAYTQQGEIHYNHMATIGVLCHELGHDLGLPDLYDYDGSSEGVGIHSIMAGGSWAYTAGGYAGSSPTHLDAWCKTKLGFADPVQVNSSGNYTVNATVTGQYNILKIPTSTASQYFLVENRQFSGFDNGLSQMCRDKGGIAIWHIDEDILRMGRAPNNNESRKGVDLEESNESILGYSQLDKRNSGFYVGSNYYVGYAHYYYLQTTGTPFKNTTIFGPATVPNSSLYDGTKTDIAITSSEPSSNSMTVKVTLPSMPDNTGTTTISYNLSEKASASIKLYDNSNNLVKTLEPGIEKSPGKNSSTWDGSNSSGSIVDDGIYTYVINAVDSVNLPAEPATGTVTVNKAPTATSVSDSPDPFRPTETNVNTIKYTMPKEANVTIKVFDKNNNLIKTLVSGTVPAGTNTTSWDGKNSSGVLAAGGIYYYKIEAVDSSGREATPVTGTITVDLTAPVISNHYASPDIFAPTGSNTLSILFNLSEDANATMSIYNSSNNLVKTLMNNALKPAGTNSVTWDGKNASGGIVGDGTYTYKISAVDLVNLPATAVSGTITIRQSYPTIGSVSDSPDPFAPNGSKFNTIKYNLSKSANVTIKIYDSSNNLIKSLQSGWQEAGNRSVDWYGDNTNGSIVQSGVYTYKIDAIDSAGRAAGQVSGTITVDLIPPKIGVISVDPDPFEPIG